eukprot:1439621-Pleurochrysis_carterae.AAC.3
MRPYRRRRALACGLARPEALMAQDYVKRLKVDAETPERAWSGSRCPVGRQSVASRTAAFRSRERASFSRFCPSAPEPSCTAPAEARRARSQAGRAEGKVWSLKRRQPSLVHSLNESCGLPSVTIMLHSKDRCNLVMTAH